MRRARCMRHARRTRHTPLTTLKRNPNFNFHPKCAEINIAHLAFADDLILFARGDPISVKLSIGCLKKFEECSWLCTNESKSNVFMAGICSEDIEEIKSITGFRMGEFPLRYLGASLSYAGRSELVKSVLQGVKCFWLSILPIPVGVKDKIISLCRNFLWTVLGLPLWKMNSIRPAGVSLMPLM
ncbi:hypothetical protein Acr_29g0007240 [Actinidia rufa]|uniref:Reverse transcriptase domain-containing protein n=1 Tax=Actinidia rufa TaxID=165716 RepID=A0A7J0HEU3_9ERIC|nr:hypothetical protein Acr_29g0007240 [Actinidia rufa]